MLLRHPLRVPRRLLFSLPVWQLYNTNVDDTNVNHNYRHFYHDDDYIDGHHYHGHVDNNDDGAPGHMHRSLRRFHPTARRTDCCGRVHV